MNKFYNYARAFLLGVLIVLIAVWTIVGFDNMTPVQNILLLTTAGFSWGFFVSGFFGKK